MIVGVNSYVEIKLVIIECIGLMVIAAKYNGVTFTIRSTISTQSRPKQHGFLSIACKTCCCHHC
jgi:hypothetical protein